MVFIDMATVKTNVFEIAFKSLLIGTTIQLKDGTPFSISDLNYDPRTDQFIVMNKNRDVRILLGTDYFNIEVSGDYKKLFPNGERIKGIVE